MSDKAKNIKLTAGQIESLEQVYGPNFRKVLGDSLEKAFEEIEKMKAKEEESEES